MNDIKRWWTIIEIIDTETGEEITKSKMERENLKINKKNIRYEIRNNSGYRIIQWECKRNEQTRLEFE